jgi:hypothetical protein
MLLFAYGAEKSQTFAEYYRSVILPGLETIDVI